MRLFRYTNQANRTKCFGMGFMLLVMTLMATKAQSQVVSSSIAFAIQNTGLTVNGTLSGLKGEINFNPEKYASSVIEVSVPVSSLKTGIEMRDTHLKKEEYFDANKYQEISLKSSFFGKRNDQYLGYFVLTIKGVSRNVTIPFSALSQNGLLILEGEFTMDRLDYKIGGKSLVLSNQVKVKIKVIVKQ